MPTRKDDVENRDKVYLSLPENSPEIPLTKNKQTRRGGEGQMEVPTHASWFFSVFFFWLVHATGKLSLGCTVLRKIQQSPARNKFLFMQLKNKGLASATYDFRREKH